MGIYTPQDRDGAQRSTSELHEAASPVKVFFQQGGRFDVGVVVLNSGHIPAEGLLNTKTERRSLLKLLDSDLQFQQRRLPETE